MEWNVEWGWVGRERHACICRLAYDVYFLGSQPPLSYYLTLAEFHQ